MYGLCDACNAASLPYRARLDADRLILQRLVGVRQRAPHVRDRAVVVPEPFLGLLEVAADDVDERIEADDRIGVERVEIVHRNEPRLHVPLVVPEHLVGRLDVRRRHVVDAEEAVIGVGVPVACFFSGKNRSVW